MYSKTLQTVWTEIHGLVRLRIFSFKVQTEKTKEDKKEEESWMSLKVGQGQQSLGELTLAEIFTHIILKVWKDNNTFSLNTANKAKSSYLPFPYFVKYTIFSQSGSSNSAIM